MHVRAFIKNILQVYVPRARSRLLCVPSTSEQYRTADMRIDSKVRLLLRHAVHITQLFRVSRHAVIAKPAVMVVSTTIVL